MKPKRLKKRIKAMEAEGWDFHEMYDGYRCRNFCHVFASRNGGKSPYRNKNYQWERAPTWDEAWSDVLKEVEKLMAHTWTI